MWILLAVALTVASAVDTGHGTHATFDCSASPVACLQRCEMLLCKTRVIDARQSAIQRIVAMRAINYRLAEAVFNESFNALRFEDERPAAIGDAAR